MSRNTRILVAGGGPAGAMTATLMAREGFDVVLCERERFPRYHIGESLLTSAMPILEFAGVRDRIERHGFVKKYGGFFRVKHGEPAGHVDFTKLSRYRHAFQVIRSEFDAILLDHAGKSGAEVREGTTVASVAVESGRPVAATVESGDGGSETICFDYMVDATGQNGLLSTKYFGARQEEPAFANVAVGGYFRGARPYRDESGNEHPGAFSMEALTDGLGWTWAIPLHDGTLSVGVVIHRDVYKDRRKLAGSLEELFARSLEISPDTTRLIDGARREGEVRAWRDYSYFATAFAGRNYRLAGDAAGFIDPLFSTGVHMAFVGALSAAATIGAEVRGEVSRDAAEDFHERCLRQAYTRFMMTVAGFYAQIRNQQEVVLPTVTKDNFQLAFDLIQPVVSGSADLNSDEIPPDLLNRALNYTTSTMLEIHDMRGNSPVARLLKSRILDQAITDKLAAVDGMYIRLERGRLGLERLGAVSAGLVGAQKWIIRGMMAVTG